MANSKLVWTVAAAAVVLTCAPAAFAADLVPPAWRGSAGTTFQQWDFSTEADPASPELVTNPYGTPSADIMLGDYAIGWLDQLPGMGSLTGYWDLGAAGTISIGIPNEIVPGAYTEVWIQVTYFADIMQAPAVQVQDGTYVDGETVVVENVDTGGSWLLDRSLWRVDPSAAAEAVSVVSDAMWGSVVDSVVVDTRNVVPEPASAAALVIGLGGVVLRRRRA